MSTKLIRKVYGMHRVATVDSVKFENDPYMRFPISVAGKVDAGKIWDGFIAQLNALPAEVRDAVLQKADAFKYTGTTMTVGGDGRLHTDHARETRKTATVNVNGQLKEVRLESSDATKQRHALFDRLAAMNKAAEAHWAPHNKALQGRSR